jgi:hypothetical protein
MGSVMWGVENRLLGTLSQEAFRAYTVFWKNAWPPWKERISRVVPINYAAQKAIYVREQPRVSDLGAEDRPNPAFGKIDPA